MWSHKKKRGKEVSYGSRVNASVLLRSQSDGVVASLSDSHPQGRQGK